VDRAVVFLKSQALHPFRRDGRRRTKGVSGVGLSAKVANADQRPWRARAPPSVCPRAKPRAIVVALNRPREFGGGFESSRVIAIRLSSAAHASTRSLQTQLASRA
jgi:hypothetical protein